MKEVKPWSCVRCDYQMDSIHSMAEKDSSDDGDFCICLNCGTLYENKEDQWELVTEVPFELRADLERLEKIRKRIVTDDLSLRQKFKSEN